LKIKILIIDDDRHLLFLADEILGMDPSFEIVQTTTSQGAIQILDEQHIDAVICDFDLGPNEMNGIELLSWVRDSGSAIPFIIFTGKSREEIAIRALNLGADYYLEKDDDLESLFAELGIYIKNVVKGRKIEAALEESEDQHRTMLKSISDLIIIVDKANTVTYVFSGEESLLRDAPENLVGEHVARALPPNQVESFQILAEKVRETNSPQAFEYHLDIDDGQRWFSVVLSPHETDKGIIYTIRDITAYRVRSDSIRHKYDFLRDIIDALAHPFYVIDANNYTIKFANKAAQLGPLTGIETCHLLTHHEDQPCSGFDHPCPLEQVKRTRRSAVVHHEHYDKDGNVMHLEIQGHPVFDEKGNVIQMIEYTIDVTEEKTAHLLLSTQKEELSELAHIMKHDLGNDLRNIRGLISLLSRKQEPEYSDRIMQIIGRMSNLLRSSAALADAGLIVEMKKDVNLNELVHEIAITTIPESITYVQDDLPSIMGDSRKIRQIFLNLFVNAIEHGKPQTIEVRKITDEQGLSILIINDGQTIPSEKRKTLFVKDADSKKEGRGFGLYIVNKLVKAHGWDIELDGTSITTFRIIIHNE